MIRTLCLTTILLIPASAALADAPASPLTQVPASAAMVVHINGLDTIQNHVAAFLKNAVPEKAAAARDGIESWLKPESLNGRKVVGLVRDGHIFLVFMDAKVFGQTPAFAMVLPVASYKEFRDGYLKPDEQDHQGRGRLRLLPDRQQAGLRRGPQRLRDLRHDQGGRRDLRQEPARPGRQAEQGAGRPLPAQRPGPLRGRRGVHEGVRRTR